MNAATNFVMEINVFPINAAKMTRFEPDAIYHSPKIVYNIHRYGHSHPGPPSIAICQLRLLPRVRNWAQEVVSFTFHGLTITFPAKDDY